MDNPNLLWRQPAKDRAGGTSLLCASEKETASLMMLALKMTPALGDKITA